MKIALRIIVLTIITIGFILVLHSMVSAQKIKSSVIDPFTKSRIITTTTEDLAGTWTPLNDVNYSITSINGALFLDINYRNLAVVAVNEGAELSFLMEGGEVVKFLAVANKLSNTEITKMGARHQSLRSGYTLEDAEHWLLLGVGRVMKIRLQLSEGHIDFEVSKARSDVFNRSVGLFDPSIAKE